MTTLPRRRPTRTVLAVLPLAAAVLVGTAGVASATKEAPVSGDDRAAAHPDNATACNTGRWPAGLDGQRVDGLGFEISGNDEGDDTYLTITDVPDGIELTGIVVKGGPAYNVYPADALTDLHAPLVPSGKPASISHWFACGIETSEPGKSSEPSEPEEPGGPGAPSESEHPAEPTTPSESGTASPSESSRQPTVSPTDAGTSTTAGSSAPGAVAPSSVPTTSGTAVAAANTDDLASTGFGTSWLIWLGGLLLLAGGGVLVLLRIRGRA